MIDQFITQAAGQFGLDASTVRDLTGQLLAKFRDDGDDDDFQALNDAVPGVGDLAEEAVPTANESALGFGGFGGGGGGGLLGGLASQAANALGAGGIADLIGQFSKAGLDLSSAGGFVQGLISFLKAKAGDELIGKLASTVPGLDKLLG